MAYQLKISDNGPGIPGPERERVFQRHYSGSNGSGGSTDLELAIAPCTVESNGGTISVEEDCGTCRTIAIRLAAHAVVPQPQKPVRRQPHRYTPLLIRGPDFPDR